MEKSMRSGVEPGKSLNYAHVAALSGGLSLYWCCLFSSLTNLPFASARTSGIAAPWWTELVCHIAFFGCFAAFACFVAHLPFGIMGKQVAKHSKAIIGLAALALFGIGGAYAASATVPQGAMVALDALEGLACACLLFLWIPLLASVSQKTLVASLSVSAVVGSAVALNLKLLAPEAACFFLGAIALACLGASTLLWRSELSATSTADNNKETNEITPDQGIPLTESRKNAHLSWSFGAINIIYGVVFGVGAGNLLQAEQAIGAHIGSAVAFALGSAAAFLFAWRSQGRVRQSTVLRMLFPVLVIALIPLSFLDAKGGLFAGCNLLVLGCCAFLSLVSIAFEIKGSNERGASALYFVGMSQTTLAGGIALGFTLDILPGLTGVFSPNVLSIVALGLVIVLAVMVTFTQSRMVDSQAQADAAIAQAKTIAEQAKQGRWKLRCAEVAAQAKLSARETEVFTLLAKGRGTEHIQNKLGISSHTVKTHTYNIYKKLGVKNREELLDLVEKG